MSRLRHLSSLDGLRGVAILSVMGFHLSWAFAETPTLTRTIKEVLWGGWVGVDLFFVLSGYLITRGLITTSTFSVGRRMKNFWVRRSLRIFPIYYIAIAVGTIVCLSVSASVPELAYWLYAQNYTLVFDADPERWTAHLWSLAIEEQFYFIWPVIVLLTTNKNATSRLRSLARWLIVIIAVAPFLRAGVVFGLRSLDDLTRAKLAYRALPTRIDPLLCGALLAMLEVTPESALARAWRRHRVKAVALSTLVIAAVVAVTRGFNFYDRRVTVIGYGVVAILFMGVVSAAVDGDLPMWLARRLGSRSLIAVGRVSYGMYLIHWPLLSLGIPYFKTVQSWTDPTQALGFALVVSVGLFTVTYGLAEASYRLIELPFLRLKDRFED